MTTPHVLLSGFADEAAVHKTITEQFVAMATLGLRHYSIRFVDAGNGTKNVMDLDDSEIALILSQQADYGLQVTSIGSPIGKVKLLDVEDGTDNRYVPFAEYLHNDVRRACELANAFQTKLIRGFSFYPPRYDQVEDHLAAAIDQIGQIVEHCAKHDVLFGLEVEANLVGRSGTLLADIWRQIDHPALVLIYDGANLLTQGYTVDQALAEYQLMKPGMGWMHVKDYKPTDSSKQDFVDEEALSDFRSVDCGSGLYQRILQDLRESLPTLTRELVERGLPGFFLELEPHVKGGGQFGGFSGPDGMGVAVRALTQLLDDLEIDHDQRTFTDTQHS